MDRKITWRGCRKFFLSCEHGLFQSFCHRFLDNPASMIRSFWSVLGFRSCWKFNPVQNDLVRISVRKIPVRFSWIANRNQENGLFLDERLFHEKSLVDNNLNRSNVPFVPIANPPLISTYRNLQGFPEWSKIDANSKFVFQF